MLLPMPSKYHQHLLLSTNIRKLKSAVTVAFVGVLHCKKEMVILTLIRLSQLQLNDIMSPPTPRYPILLRLKACGQSVGCLQ